MSQLCTKTVGGGMEGGGAGPFWKTGFHRASRTLTQVRLVRLQAEFSECMLKCTVNLTRKETKL